MTDKTELLKLFVENFIQKDKRERCLQELIKVKYRNKFTDSLNHNWKRIFNMKTLRELDKNQDSYIYVQQQLKMKDSELCYLISDEEDDDTIFSFKDAFEIINSATYGGLLINIAGNKLFLKTEDSLPHTSRYIGVVTSVTSGS